MKRVKILLSAILAITTVISVGAQSSYIVTVEAASKADCFLDQDGKNATIMLRGNPSTGYEWKCNVKNPGIANMIYQDYIPGESMGNAFEPDGTYVWKFAGFWQGETEVTFTCEKEGVAEPAETITYIVSVDSDLNINFTEKKQDSQTGSKTVEFEGNADLIKHWRPEAYDTGIVDVINKGYKDYYDDDYKYEHNQKILLWDIKGLKEGETVAAFTYSRPWENRISETVTYKINVDSDLNVTISKNN